MSSLDDDLFGRSGDGSSQNNKVSWHLWMRNPQHSSKYDKPEREIIAFSTGYIFFNESSIKSTFNPAHASIITWLLPPLALGFVLSNLFLIRGMYSLAQWRYPPAIYISILALIDLISNTPRFIDLWIQMALNNKLSKQITPFHPITDLATSSDAICATLTGSIYLMSHIYSLLFSVFALHIPKAHTNPLPTLTQPRQLISQTRHLILLLLALLLITNSHFLWTYSLLSITNHPVRAPVPPGRYCTYLVKWVSPTFRDVIWPLFDLIVADLLPLLSILITTLLMIWHQIRSNNSCKNHGPSIKFHLIDHKAFMQLRKFSFYYIYLTLIFINIPNLTFDLVTLLRYQMNHANKLVTTFPTVRSATRFKLTSSDISGLYLSRIFMCGLFPIASILLAFNISKRGFKQEILNYLRWVSSKTVPLDYSVNLEPSKRLVNFTI